MNTVITAGRHQHANAARLAVGTGLGDVHDCEAEGCAVLHSAWRLWRLELDDGQPRLCSPWSGHPWPSRRPMIADCRHHEGRAPRAGCDCGIRVVATADELARYMLTAWVQHEDGNPHHLDTAVLGEVACRGLILRGGYLDTPDTLRVEKAAILRLYLPGTLADYGQALADDYQAKITTTQLVGAAWLASFLDDPGGCVICADRSQVGRGSCADRRGYAYRHGAASLLHAAGLGRWAPRGMADRIYGGTALSRSSQRRPGGRR